MVKGAQLLTAHEQLLHERADDDDEVRLAVDIYPPGQIPPNAKNRFSELIPSQSIAVIDKFKLESGIELKDVSVGFRTWGRLNET